MTLPKFLTLAAALAFTATPALAQKVDWTKRTSMTNIGGYVVGNPDAKTRLVEYISYTCGHCAEFTNKAEAPLKVNWIARGTINVEIRNAVRDRYDLTAALLARCGGPTKFFGNHQTLFANFDKWMKQVVAYEAKERPAAATIDAAMADIAAGTGLNALMQRRGFTPAQLRTCLADKGAREKVLAMTKQAWEGDKISGTPSFIVNGRLLKDVHDWTGLEPALPAVGN
jgi:protein-disulfide isomerase